MGQKLYKKEKRGKENILKMEKRKNRKSRICKEEKGNERII